MRMPVFWVGQVPRQSLVMDVVNQRGEEIDLSRYNDISLIMIGADNRRKQLNGTLTVNQSKNRVLYNWESTSLFDKPGDYIVQLELEGDDFKDYSSPVTFVVRELGKRRI